MNLRTPHRRLRLAACLLLAGCSAVVSPDTNDLGPAPPLPCIPGTKIQCVCIGGATGTQTCTATERFEACECSAPAGTAGTGAN